MSDGMRNHIPSRAEEARSREQVIRRPDDPDAPAHGMDDSVDPIPEPNEPA